MGSWGASHGRFKMAAREAGMMVVQFQCVQIAFAFSRQLDRQKHSSHVNTRINGGR